MENLVKIGFGGGCHWCTEAVFQSLNGVEKVAQGWIASDGEASSFSEAVIVHFKPLQISLAVLVEIHLRTHKSTSEHSMRKKYRSAIYYFDAAQQIAVNQLLNGFQSNFDNQLITQVLPHEKFKPSGADFENYYYKNPEKPFCETFINPKLKVLLNQFSTYTKIKNLLHLSPENYDTKIR